MRRHFRGNGGLFLSFFLKLSPSPKHKEEQLTAIKAVYEGMALCCLMWEKPLVPNSAVCYGIRTWWR